MIRRNEELTKMPKGVHIIISRGHRTLRIMGTMRLRLKKTFIFSKVKISAFI